MINPIRLFTLAADARRIERLLKDETFAADGLSLSQKVDITLGRLLTSRAALSLRQEILEHIRDERDAANAKIARMQGGLKQNRLV